MFLPRLDVTLRLLHVRRAGIAWSATDAVLSKSSLITACAQDKPSHSAAYKPVCSGQAFAQCGAAKRAHGITALVSQGNTPARRARF